MSDPKITFSLDGHEVPVTAGQTILQAAEASGSWIPTLCHHPEFEPHGSCRVCTVKLNGRTVSACTTPVKAGDVVELDTEELKGLRQNLVQFLFTEGNHFCPSCEQSGDCRLQAVGYALEVTGGHYNPLFPSRRVDASHPEVLLELNRCILCELCVRASAQVDKKDIFALSGRGIDKHLVVNAESGRLADTNLALTDKALSVCPVGAILKKRQGFLVPIGARTYDERSIRERDLDRAKEDPK